MAAPALAAALAIAAAAATGPIEGHWLNPEKSVLIRLAPCGEAMCGTVTWASEKAKSAARKGVDQLVGARLLTDFHRNARGQWRGRIFVPDHNMHVSGRIQPLAADKLKVSGCMFAGMLCGTQVWTRTDEAVPRGG